MTSMRDLFEDACGEFLAQLERELARREGQRTAEDAERTVARYAGAMYRILDEGLQRMLANGASETLARAEIEQLRETFRQRLQERLRPH